MTCRRISWLTVCSLFYKCGCNFRSICSISYLPPYWCMCRIEKEFNRAGLTDHGHGSKWMSCQFSLSFHSCFFLLLLFEKTHGITRGQTNKNSFLFTKTSFIFEMWNKAPQGESFVCHTHLLHVSLQRDTNSMFSS